MLLLILSLLLNCSEAAYKYKGLEIKQAITVLGGFDTNALYAESSTLDTVFKLEPLVGLGYKIDQLYFYAEGDFEYNKYFKYSRQSNFNWMLNNQIKLEPDENSRVELINMYERSSDFTLVESESRAKWKLHTFKIDAYYKSHTNFWSLTGTFESLKTKYALPEFSNFDNAKRYFSLINRFNFFPETAFKFGVKAGFVSYTPSDTVALPYYNSDSIHYEGFVGIDGRITSTIKMDMKFGFIYLDYQRGTSFTEPVLSVEFTDIVSPVTSISAYYERMPYDSIYSNFYVDQKLSLEGKALWRDNFISLAKVQYIYRYYRYYPKRIDHRMAFISEVALPFWVLDKLDKNICFLLRFMAEWINSDAYNDFGYYTTGPDLSADYKRYVILFGISTKY